MATYPDPFSRCKLCRADNSRPTYRLVQGIVYCCPTCDFHYLDHLDGPTPENAPNLNAAGRRYIESRRDEGAHLHPARLHLVRQLCPVQSAATLDIGAGLGQFMLLLQQSGASALGIEPSSLRRTYARETYGVQLHPQLVDEDFWQSGYRDVFDLITLWDVIEHVNDPVATLKNAVALLKPGGYLCLDTPDREVFSYRFSQTAYRVSGGRLPLFLEHFYSATRYGHKQIFTRHQISALLQDCGLTLVTLHLHGQSNRAFSRKIVLAARKP